MQDRYDELENIVDTLDTLADEITDKYYIDMINELKYEAQQELEEVEKDIQEEQEAEEKEMNYEYERSRL